MATGPAARLRRRRRRRAAVGRHRAGRGGQRARRRGAWRVEVEESEAVERPLTVERLAEPERADPTPLSIAELRGLRRGSVS